MIEYSKYAEGVSTFAKVLAGVSILVAIVIGFLISEGQSNPLNWGLLFGNVYASCILLLLDAILLKGSNKAAE